MPLVRVRILQGATVVATPTKPFPDETTVKAVLEKALTGYTGFTVRSLDTFPDATEKVGSRSQFDPADFSDITVGEIALNNLRGLGTPYVQYTKAWYVYGVRTVHLPPYPPPTPPPTPLSPPWSVRSVGQ